jgi:CRISPR-associated protein Csx10
MKTITFLITSEQPLLLTSLQGDPNSSVSFAYVPGSAIRGALIARFNAKYGQIDPADATIQRLFFDHQTRYLNAYLYAWYGTGAPQRDSQGVPLPFYARSLPTPRAWQREKRADVKHEQIEGFDSSIALQPTMLDEDEEGMDASPAAPQPPEHPQGMDHAFCWLRGVTPVLFTEQRHINVHNQRDRPYGRGKQGSRAVFRYDAVAPNQTFQAVILCDDDDDSATIKGLLQVDHLWLGGSRSAGYGRVRLSDVQEHTAWNEVDTPPTQRLGAGELHVTLLSDMVVRDVKTGQYSGIFPTQAIAAQLGLAEDSLDLVPERTIYTLTQHSGFNRTWGLPTPQMLALAAGSVFVWRVPAGTLDVQRVATLEARGLGERRAEGFGRLAINWRLGKPVFTAQVPTQYQYLPPIVPLDRPEQTQHLDDESQTLAAEMARTLLRKRLDQKLIERVARTSIQGDISNTQLSRLHIVARRAMGDTDMQRLDALLKKLPQNARDLFETAKIENQRLMHWLNDRIAKPAEGWNVASVTVAGVAVGVDAALAHEYTLRLIMAVARQRVKEER